MVRIARIVVPGLPHHITQRGNRRQPVFDTVRDYQRYMRLLQQYTTKYGLSILAYCLMPNHVHLLGIPVYETSLALSLRDTHTAYAVHYNRQTEVIGHLWQGRFFSCVLDEAHCWTAIRYVEQNPVRAGLVNKAADYPWSSAAAHCGLRHDPLLDFDAWPLNEISNWAAWLAEDEPGETTLIRQQTLVGRPCGSATFSEILSERLNRPVLPQKRGRKPKGG